tara:strand:- start:29 stop:1051 length:1023 start_codon:yes stop_codon:yes gene_type:complete
MAFSTIDKSTLYQNQVLYTGNGATKPVTGVGFQPDWVWIKNRSVAFDHQAFDVIRGVTYRVSPNTNSVQTEQAASFTSFDSDGFTVDNYDPTNQLDDTFVGWCWKAGGAGSANEVGSIDSTVSVNTTAGFSIVKYTGNGVSGTVGHGLGTVPKFIITKNLSATGDWSTYHATLGGTKTLYLDLANASGTTSSPWNNTDPTSTVFSVGGGAYTNGDGNSIIAYCFAEVPGFSKFSSYVGNANVNGQFVFTGFAPSFVIFKNTAGTSNWEMENNKMPGYNVVNKYLLPNLADIEGTVDRMDFLSNGFKLRTTGSNVNSAVTYVYAAFGQPIVSNSGTPATAR